MKNLKKVLRKGSYAVGLTALAVSIVSSILIKDVNALSITSSVLVDNTSYTIDTDTSFTEYSLNGANYINIGDATTTHGPITLIEGTNTLLVKDASGVVSDSVTIIADTTKPTIITTTIARTTTRTGVIDSAYAITGDKITLAIIASENITSPTVTIEGQIAEVTGSGSNYTATYQVVTVDPDGVVDIIISDFNDDAGNAGEETTDITTGSVTIDQTMPTLTEATITTSNTNKAFAKVGDTITLSLTFSEALGVNPTVTIAGEAATTVTGSGINYMATYVVKNTDSEETVKINVSNVTDIAGNVNSTAFKTISGDDITIDRTNPVITTKIETDNDSEEYAKSGDTITLTIEADESLGITPTVTIAGQSVTVRASGENKDEYIASYEVESTTVEGTVAINISRLRDVAGNTIGAITTATEGDITIDTSAPTVSNASIKSDNEVDTKAKLGDTITLSLTFNENLETAPIVRIAGQNAKVIGSGIEYTATYEVTEEAIEGDAEISIRGYINNTGFEGETVTEATSGSVAIDRTPPTLTTKIVSNNTDDDEFAKLGDIITLSIESDEDLANKPTVTIAGITTVVTGSGTNYRATYVIDASSAEGIADIKISGIIDKTGNEGVEVEETTEGTVEIDNSGPTLLAIIQSNNLTNTGLAKIGDTIILIIEANENLLEAPTVTIAGESAVVEGSGSTYTATYEVDEDTTEGNVTININDYEDKAGNIGVEITSVTTGYVKVDLVNPTILSESETPTKDYELIGDEGIQAYSLDDGETWIVLDTVSSRKIISFSAEQRYEIKIKDVAGNISETKTVGYYRPESILIPDIKIIGPASINIGIGTEYEELGFIAIDGDGTILNDIVEIEKEDFDEDKAGEYVITYSVTNEQGRIKSATRTVKVVRTTETITNITLVTLKGSSPLYLDINEEYEELGVSIDESIEQESVKIDGEIDTSKVGIYELIYTVLDKDGDKYTAKRAVVVTGKKESKELAIDINEGFQTFTVDLESPLLKLEDTEILYVVSDSEPALDAEWQSTEGQINLSTTEEGTSLYALIRNKSAYEIIKVTELKYYEKIESTNQSKISYKIDGKDYSLTDINENIQNQWIQEKEIMKVYESAEGKAVEFENSEKYNMEKVTIYYEITNETTESTLSLIPIASAADMPSVELAKGEKLVVEVPNGKVLRYKIETLTTGGDKDISNEYKLSVNQEGKIIINTTLATTKYTTMIITIAIIAAVAGLGVLVYSMTKKSSKI